MLESASWETSENSAANPIAPSGQAKSPRVRGRITLIQRVAGVVIALAGGGTLIFSLQFFLFHPMTSTDEAIGPWMWVAGSWLFGGGVTLIFGRPWVAALVGFMSPALTSLAAMIFYFALLLLAPVLS